MTVSWNLVSPALKTAGYCVFALDLVRRGMAPIDQSADKLAAFIDEVRTRTGAPTVSIVGHSQGGMLGRYVARFRGKLGGDRRHRRARPIEPRNDEPARARRGPDLPGVRRAGRRLGVHAEAQRPAGSAAAAVLHGRVDQARRGRHAVPVAGAGGRHERRPPGPLPRGHHGPRRDHLRPDRAPVDDERPRAPRARRPGVPADLQQRHRLAAVRGHRPQASPSRRRQRRRARRLLRLGRPLRRPARAARPPRPARLGAGRHRGRRHADAPRAARPPAAQGLPRHGRRRSSPAAT